MEHERNQKQGNGFESAEFTSLSYWRNEFSCACDFVISLIKITTWYKHIWTLKYICKLGI